jgi:hypothetical protein
VGGVSYLSLVWLCAVMSFETFTGGRSSRGSQVEPRLSLRKSGKTIGINSNSMGKYFSDVDHVELAYDKANRRVGCRLMENETPNSYSLRKGDKEGHGGQVTCRAFLVEYGLVPDKTTQYAARWDDEHDLVVIDLDDPVLVYGD